MRLAGYGLRLVHPAAQNVGGISASIVLILPLLHPAIGAAFRSWANEESQLHVVHSTAELEEGKRILSALHQGRWGEETGKFGSPRFAAFHAAVMPALLQEGALELLWLSVRGEPVAAVYNIVWNQKVYFYQSGRKVDVPSGVRPGIVLHAQAIRRAIEAGRREYDFLGGGEHYKGQMALASRPLVQLAWRAPRSWSGRAQLPSAALGWRAWFAILCAAGNGLSPTALRRPLTSRKRKRRTVLSVAYGQSVAYASGSSATPHGGSSGFATRGSRLDEESIGFRNGRADIPERGPFARSRRRASTCRLV